MTARRRGLPACPLPEPRRRPPNRNIGQRARLDDGRELVVPDAETLDRYASTLYFGLVDARCAAERLLASVKMGGAPARLAADLHRIHRTLQALHNLPGFLTRWDRFDEDLFWSDLQRLAPWLPAEGAGRDPRRRPGGRP